MGPQDMDGNMVPRGTSAVASLGVLGRFLASLRKHVEEGGRSISTDDRSDIDADVDVELSLVGAQPVISCMEWLCDVMLPAGLVTKRYQVG